MWFHLPVHLSTKFHENSPADRQEGKRNVLEIDD